MKCLTQEGDSSENHLYHYQADEAYFSDRKSDRSSSDDRSAFSVIIDQGNFELPMMVTPNPSLINTHFGNNNSNNTINPTCSSIIGSNLHFHSSHNSTSYVQSILNPMFMKTSKENYIQPIYDAKLQQVILPIECGRNRALMYLNRLCQGSKGACILFKNYYWLTPNEFQYISGRETAKDWKRSIRHNGKSIKLLINKGILIVHSPLCECGTATSSFLKMEKESQRFNQGNDTFKTLLVGACNRDTTDNDNGGGITSEEDISSSNRNNHKVIGATWTTYMKRPKSATSVGDIDSIGTEGSSPRSMDWNFSSSVPGTSPPIIITSNDEINSYSEDPVTVTEDAVTRRKCSVSKSPDWNSISVPSAAESQSEESSLTGGQSTMNNNNNNNDSPTPPTKSKRKSKQSIAVKSERQSPQLSSSTTSPPMTPPPPTSSSGHNQNSGSPPPPQQPIKQMEQMMTSNARNYSDFMRSLAAKYNQSNLSSSEYYSRASPAANFAFDTRFLKPAAAAAALMNLGCSQLPSSIFAAAGGDKDKFPMIDMSSTQTLLSMVRSASAAANNLETLKTNKRPNSPLDLSSRDLPSTPPPPLKKGKLRNPLLDVTLKTTATPCLSSCSTGCTEEAQTMINWSVEEVCRFVSNIDLCKDYVEVFREHAIDGSSLPLLTEEHLMNAMNMKLGPALKFKSTIARKIGTCVVCLHCTHCHSHNNNGNA